MKPGSKLEGAPGWVSLNDTECPRRERPREAEGERRETDGSRSSERN